MPLRIRPTSRSAARAGAISAASSTSAPGCLKFQCRRVMLKAPTWAAWIWQFQPRKHSDRTDCAWADRACPAPTALVGADVGARHCLARLECANTSVAVFKSIRPCENVKTLPMNKSLPESVEEFLASLQLFEALLNKAKQPPIGDIYQWYPYTTISSIHHLLPVLSRHFNVFRRSLESGRVLDLGCADGDLAYFFASLGCGVAAVDLPASNFNWMRGVRTLGERLNHHIHIHEIDLDAQFSLPHEAYGLVLFLGLLYHLKSPLHVLESLARTSRYCLLSTRVAQVTPAGTFIQAEPVAYLLDHREANDDPTNYWIFSEAGLLRLIKRAGWRVVGSNLVGCREASDRKS